MHHVCPQYRVRVWFCRGLFSVFWGFWVCGSTTGIAIRYLRRGLTQAGRREGGGSSPAISSGDGARLVPPGKEACAPQGRLQVGDLLAWRGARWSCPVVVSTSKLQSVVVTAADPAAAASHRPTADPTAPAAAAASHKQPWWLLSGLLVLQRTGDQRRRDACEVLLGMHQLGAGHGSRVHMEQLNQLRLEQLNQGSMT